MFGATAHLALAGMATVAVVVSVATGIVFGLVPALHGSRAYGSPMQARFQGKGVVGGEEWIYNYIGWLVPVWPNSTNELQARAMAVDRSWRGPAREYVAAYRRAIALA